jgi:hypothetical protein
MQNPKKNCISRKTWYTHLYIENVETVSYSLSHEENVNIVNKYVSIDEAAGIVNVYMELIKRILEMC